jgi:hypothetical protein
MAAKAISVTGSPVGLRSFISVLLHLRLDPNSSRRTISLRVGQANHVVEALAPTCTWPSTGRTAPCAAHATRTAGSRHPGEKRVLRRFGRTANKNDWPILERIDLYQAIRNRADRRERDKVLAALEADDDCQLPRKGNLSRERASHDG